MKKNSRKLDHLIGSIYYDSLDKSKCIRMVVDIEYETAFNNLIIEEILHGPYAGKKLKVIEEQFLKYHVEIK